MKKSVLKIFTFVLALTMLLVSTSQIAYAKTYISDTSISLKVGMGKKLTVKGAGWADPTWSSSNKKIAKVSRNGDVVALKKGTATITAKLGKKKYRCKVKVTGGNSFNTKTSDYADYKFWGDAAIWPTKIWYTSDGKVKAKIKIKNDTSYPNTLFIYELEMDLIANLKNGKTKRIAYGVAFKDGVSFKLGPNESVYKTITLDRKGGVDFKKVKSVAYEYDYYGKPDDDDFDDFDDDDYDDYDDIYDY